MINLLDLDVDGLARLFAEMGEKPFRARQVSRWLHQRFVDDIAAMTDLARPLRERLAGVALVRGPAVIRDSTASDGTRKWLLDVGGGNAVEAVYIPEGDRDVAFDDDDDAAAALDEPANTATATALRASAGRSRSRVLAPRSGAVPRHAVRVVAGGLRARLRVLLDGQAGLQPQPDGGRDRRPAVARQPRAAAPTGLTAPGSSRAARRSPTSC